MQYDASTQIQRAIIAALNANAPLTAAVAGRVFDTAPPDAKMPCVAMSTIIVTPFDTSDTQGFELNLQLSVFTAGDRARPDAWAIGALIDAALVRNETALVMPNWVAVLFDRAGSTVFRTDTNPAAPEAHGVFRYRALVRAV